jgi:hypothetical protein
MTLGVLAGAAARIEEHRRPAEQALQLLQVIRPSDPGGKHSQHLRIEPGPAPQRRAEASPRERVSRLILVPTIANT